MKLARAMVLTSLLLGGLVNIAPLAAISGAPMLLRMYGITVEDPNLLLLLQHRALLFGLLGALLLAAMASTPLRTPALVAGLISMLGFIVLAGLLPPSPALSTEIGRVVLIDWLALPVLLLGLGAQLWLSRAARNRGDGVN